MENFGLEQNGDVINFFILTLIVLIKGANMCVKAEIVTDDDDDNDDIKLWFTHPVMTHTHLYIDIMQILSKITQYFLYSICHTACFDLHDCH
jgi:hypothetical protein